MKWSLDDILEEGRSNSLTNHFTRAIGKSTKPYRQRVQQAHPSTDTDIDSAELYDEDDEDESTSDLASAWNDLEPQELV